MRTRVPIGFMRGAVKWRDAARRYRPVIVATAPEKARATAPR